MSGKLLQEKALLVSLELGHDNFTASNGWLESFKNRYNITASCLNGELADVNVQQLKTGRKDFQPSLMALNYAIYLMLMKQDSITEVFQRDH